MTECPPSTIRWNGRSIHLRHVVRNGKRGVRVSISYEGDRGEPRAWLDLEGIALFKLRKRVGRFVGAILNSREEPNG